MLCRPIDSTSISSSSFSPSRVARVGSTFVLSNERTTHHWRLFSPKGGGAYNPAWRHWSSGGGRARGECSGLQKGGYAHWIVVVGGVPGRCSLGHLPKAPPRGGAFLVFDTGRRETGCTGRVNCESGMKLVGQKSVSSRRLPVSFEAMEALHASRKRRVHTVVV